VFQTRLFSVTVVVEFVEMVAEKNLLFDLADVRLPELKAEPLNPFAAETQVTPEPLDQLEIVTPLGGVVQVAVGTAGQEIVAPPPIVTVVCEKVFVVANKDIKIIAKFFKIFIGFFGFFYLIYQTKNVVYFYENM
jgi:hypothetical protein